MPQATVLVLLGFLIAATTAAAGQQAEPAKTAAAPHAGEPAKRAVSVPTKEAQGRAPSSAASRPPASKSKTAAENDLNLALLRIQERIDKETRPTPRPRPPAARRVVSAPAPAPVSAPVVMLMWKTTITWPVELATPAPPHTPPAAVRMAPIELTWK